MSSFMLALSVVLPLIVYMTVGGLIRKFSIFSKENFKALNGLIFKVFIPLTLFVNVYGADLGETLKPDVFLLILVQVLFLYFTTLYIVFRMVKEKAMPLSLSRGFTGATLSCSEQRLQPPCAGTEAPHWCPPFPLWSFPFLTFLQ